MRKVLQTKISESVEILKSHKSKVYSYKSSKRLDSLLLLKRNDYSRLEDLAIELEISITTLRRWLKSL